MRVYVVTVRARHVRNFETEVQVWRSGVDRSRAERSDLLATIDMIADFETFDDRIQVHVRRERAVVVLYADIATAATVSSELGAFDSNNDAVCDCDYWPTDRSAKVNATMARATFRAHHANATGAEERCPAIGELLVRAGDGVNPIEQ